MPDAIAAGEHRATICDRILVVKRVAEAGVPEPEAFSTVRVEMAGAK